MCPARYCNLRRRRVANEQRRGDVEMAGQYALLTAALTFWFSLFESIRKPLERWIVP
jgi:hypothetical protein